MATGRKSHNPYIIRIDIPYRGTVADGSDRIVCVGQRDVAITIRHTVCQHKIGDTLSVEVFCPVVSLMIHGEMAVSTARA